MAYLLDANVFIQAKNLQYGFDFCPAFWDWMAQSYTAGRLRSLRQVGDELSAGGDELATWAQGIADGFFPAPDAAVLTAAQKVSAWVLQQGYEPAAVNTFLQVADFWLVAAALAGQHTVVTHEVASPSTRKIKIPNVHRDGGELHVTLPDAAQGTGSIHPGTATCRGLMQALAAQPGRFAKIVLISRPGIASAT